MAGFDKHRKRRVIYNDDGDQQYDVEVYDYNVKDDQSFIDARTTATFDTHVDTYAWCVGTGCHEPWGRRSEILPSVGSCERAADLIVEACHARGIEVWGALRMNDLHDSFRAERLEDANDPIKAEHPEYLIAPESNRDLPPQLRERALWTAFNFAQPGVREHRLAFIERDAAIHDYDGYELDFTRFIWNFPLGEERQNAGYMTDLVRRVRGCLNDIGERRGRPYTFVAHVMDSPSLSLELGQDVEAWLDEGLVDVLVVGMGYLPYCMRLNEWLGLGRRHGVPVYPSVNTNIYSRWAREVHDNQDVWREAIRGSSAYYWSQDADGVYIFNSFCAPAAAAGGLPSSWQHALLKEIGEPAELAGKDKFYAIQPTAQSGFCHHGSAAAPLPIALDSVERKLPLKVGPDADDPGAHFRISVWTTGGSDETCVWLRLNHRLLAEPARDGPWLHLDVPGGVLRTGGNELNIWCNQAAQQTDRPMIVHCIFVSAKYGAES